MAPPGPRLPFAGFLDRPAADCASAEEWQAHAVAHYGDAVLEDVRRQCVRLAIDAASWGHWLASEREGRLPVPRLRAAKLVDRLR